MIDLDTLDFTKGNGLVTVVVQDDRTGAVLMVAHADRDAVERTRTSGELHLFSRTRGPWHKGATSGNTMRVVSLTPDCDRDTILARVVPSGPACHTGATSCFENARADVLDELDGIIAERQAKPEGYTGKLLGDRNLRLKKLGEEAAELAVACADEDRERATEEAADVVYHVLVALRGVGAGWNAVREALAKRRK